MPNYSILRYVGTSAHNTTIYPNGSPYGQVEFIKSGSAYGHGTFFADTNNVNRGTYELYYNQGNINGWFRNYSEGNLTPSDIGAGVVNPNLLDNWYFGNPVNQRGFTSGGSTFSGYTVDRWQNGKYRNGEKSVTLNDGFITIACPDTTDNAYMEIYQLLDAPSGVDLTGKPITVSILTDTGVHSKTFTAIGGTYSTFVVDNECTVYFRALNTGDKTTDFRIRSYTGETVNLIAAKIELGDTQTLAHQDENGNWVLNEIPNYAEQMAICKQYNPETGEYIGLTPASIGALSTSGGRLSGNLDIDAALYPRYAMNVLKDDGTLGTRGSIQTANNIVDIAVVDNISAGTGQERGLRLRTKSAQNSVANALVLREKIAGETSFTEYKLYGEHNKPTAADVGALSTTGGTVTGNIALDKSGGVKGYSSIYKNNSTTANYGINITDADESDNRLTLTINANDNTVKLIRKLSGGTNTTYDVYHTGNKPTAADIGAAAATHNQAASTITSGTFAANRIPALDAGKITSGTFAAARIPSLAASKISAGTFAGQVVANSSGQTYSTYLLRNTRLASADTNPTVNGQICWTYG